MGLVDSWLFNLLSYQPMAATCRRDLSKDSTVFEKYFKRMKKEVEDGTAPHSWGKEFVQSNYSKYGIDEMIIPQKQLELYVTKRMYQKRTLFHYNNRE